MRHITTIAVTATTAAALALTGCSSSDAGKPAKPKPAATTSTPEKPSAADQIKACTDAIAAGRDKGDGAPECTSLELDDYYDALDEANRQGQDAMQKRIDEASEAAQP